MKTTIRPVRHHQRANRWIPTTFEHAMAYELWTTGSPGRPPRRLCRRSTLAEAKHAAALLEPRRRTREQCIGLRYSEVREEVAARNAQVRYSTRGEG